MFTSERSRPAVGAQSPFDTLTISSIAEAWSSVQTSIASNPQSYHSTIFRFMLQHIKFLPFLALCYVTAINSSVIINYSRFTAPSYFSWQLNTTVRRTNKSILYVHIIGSLFEIFRWHIRALGQELPQADVLDLALYFVQAFTNLALNKNMARGYPIMTRPAYQAGAFLRPAETFFAWYTGTALWHMRSVKIINAFAYTRLLIWTVRPLIKSRHEDAASNQAKYNLAVFGAAMLAIVEGGGAYRCHVYVVSTVLLAQLNRWTSQEITKPSHSKAKDSLLHFLAWASFIELEQLRALPNAGEPRPYDTFSDHEKHRNHGVLEDETVTPVNSRKRSVHSSD